MKNEGKKVSVEYLEKLLAKITKLKELFKEFYRKGPEVNILREYEICYRDIHLDIEFLKNKGVYIEDPNRIKSLDANEVRNSYKLPFLFTRYDIDSAYLELTSTISLVIRKYKLGEIRKGELLLELMNCFSLRKSYIGDSLVLMDFIHPKILEKSGFDFENSKYDNAILNAFKTIEVEIREKTKEKPQCVGVDLVSKVMNPKAPALVLSKIAAEQEAGHALFRGALGFLKNPQSHRFINIENKVIAFEILCFASYLMRLLDSSESKP